MPFADADQPDEFWTNQFTKPAKPSDQSLPDWFRQLSRRPERPLSRTEQLNVFVPYMHELLRGVPHVFLIMVQSADEVRSRRFNRGKLLNLGFQEAERHGCDVVCFHDVDLLPPPSLADLYMQRPETQPCHLGLCFQRYRELPNYFGGVLLTTAAQFRAMQGFPNTIWGWGYEDASLYFRMMQTLRYQRAADPVYQRAVSQRENMLDLEYLPDYQSKSAELRTAQAKCPIQYELRDREQKGGFWVFDTLARAAVRTEWLTRRMVTAKLHVSVLRLGPNDDLSDVM